MPIETKDAVTWAYAQTVTDPYGNIFPVTKETVMELVDAIRQYFNANKIPYNTFSYSDLEPYL